jgi:hypothetical protein
VQRLTPADVDQMRANGYDRATIADAEVWLAKCRHADEPLEQVRQPPPVVLKAYSNSKNGLTIN